MLFACSPNSVDGGKAKQTGAISDDMSSAGWFVPLPGGRGFLALPLILIPGFSRRIQTRVISSVLILIRTVVIVNNKVVSIILIFKAVQSS
jgi:hypothetical protein